MMETFASVGCPPGEVVQSAGRVIDIWLRVRLGSACAALSGGAESPRGRGSCRTPSQPNISPNNRVPGHLRASHRVSLAQLDAHSDLLIRDEVASHGTAWANEARPTDQKVVGSSPSERAAWVQVSASFLACRGESFVDACHRLVTERRLSRLPTPPARRP